MPYHFYSNARAHTEYIIPKAKIDHLEKEKKIRDPR